MAPIPAANFTPRLVIPLRDGAVYYVPPSEDVYPLLDAYPGLFICTSTTHPTTWGTSQAGMHISEADTGLTWYFNGSIFVRTHGTGVLAMTQRTGGMTTASLTPTAVLTVSPVVPPGNRQIKISAQVSQIYNSSGSASLTLFRQTLQLQQLFITSGVSTGGGANIDAYDNPGPGTWTYTLEVNSLISGSTTTINAGAGSPIALQAVEH